MANQLKLDATITPANTAVEASYDSGTKYYAVAMSTVNGQQEGILTNVPAGTYPEGTIKLRAIAFPNVVQISPGIATVVNAATKPLHLIFFGNSLTAGFGLSNPSVDAWAPKATALLNGYAVVDATIGHSGYETPQFRPLIPTEITPLRNTAWDQWVVFQELINNVTNSSSVPAFYQNLKDVIADLKAQGFKVAVFTSSPRGSGVDDRWAGLQQVNQLVRDNVGTVLGADMVLDVPSSHYFNTPDKTLDMTVFQADNLHWAPGGNTVVAHLVNDGFRGSRTGVVPATYELAAPAPTFYAPPTAGLVAQYTGLASSMQVDASGNLTQWNDVSGNNRHAIAPNVPGRYAAIEAYKASGRKSVAIRPLLAGTAPTNIGLKAAGAYPANSDYTLLFEATFNHYSEDTIVSSGLGPGGHIIWHQSDDILKLYGSGNVGSASPEPQPQVAPIFRYAVRFTHATRLVEFFRDGVTLGTGTVPGTNPGTVLEIGTWDNGHGLTDACIAYLSMHSRVLTAAELSTFFAAADL